MNRSILDWLRRLFKLKPGKPAYIYGVWILLVLGGPILVGFLLGYPQISAIPAVSALFVGMINKNGSYRQQAAATGTATVALALALLIANLVNTHFGLSIVATFVIVFCLALISVLGTPMASIGLTTSIAYIIFLAKFSTFPTLEIVFEQCLLCLAGGLWTMLMSSGLWILRPHTPAVEAVAESYRALGKLAQLAEEKVVNPQKEKEWAQRFLQQQDLVTQNLTSARNIWASIWATDKIGSPRGNQLLILIEDASQIIDLLVALAELIVIASRNSFFKYLQSDIEQSTEQVSVSLLRLATGLRKDRKSIPIKDLTRNIEKLNDRWQTIRSQVADGTIKVSADKYTELTHLRKIVNSLSALSEQIDNAVNIATDLTLSLTSSRKFILAQSQQPSWKDTIKKNLTFRSLALRHALRLAIIVTIACLLTNLLSIPRGYWITLTALIALKPDFGGTLQSIGQRSLGTVIGSIIGIVTITSIHNSDVITGLIFLLLFVAMSFRSLSYSIFVIFLTPVIILLIGAMGSADWQIGVLRIIYSFIGGLLAFFGSYLLFPSWQAQRLSTQLETTIQANLAYFQIAIDGYLEGQDSTWENSLVRLRDLAAVENCNAEAAARRLFSEPRHISGEIEPVLTIVLYIRSLFTSVTTLTVHLQELRSSDRHPFTQIEPLTTAIEQALSNLALAIAHKQELQPLPSIDDYLSTIADYVQQLHTTRLDEIPASLNEKTPTLLAIREKTPVVTELNQIVRAVKIIHNTIGRIKAVETHR